MATSYTEFDTSYANLVADLKTNILLSSDWAEIGGAGSNILKATTTRGAQMVVHLTDAAITTSRMQIAFYRTHDGTTGVDKLGNRYVPFQGGATSGAVFHCVVSVSKEHLYVTVEGPRWNEPGGDTGHGSARINFGIYDVVPYHAADTVPAVVVLASPINSVDQTDSLNTWAYVSRNQANTTSWVPARLKTLIEPNAGTMDMWFNNRPMRASDGKDYLAPYVVFEHPYGIRGRLNKIYHAGFTATRTAEDSTPIPGTTLDYGAEGYKLLNPYRGANNFHVWGPLGSISNNAMGQTVWGHGPLVAVPDGT